MATAQSKISLRDSVTISVAEFPRCFSLLLLMVANDLILREPGIAMSSIGMEGYNLEFVRIWLNVAFFGVLLVAGFVSVVTKKEASLRVLCVLQGVSGAVSIAAAVAFAIFSSAHVPDVCQLLPYLLFFFLGLFAAFGLLIWVVKLSELSCELAWIELIGCLFVSAFAYVFFLYLADAFPAWAVFGALYCASFAANVMYAREGGERQSAQAACDETSAPQEARQVEGATLPDSPSAPLLRAVKENYGSILCIAALNYVLTASRMVLESASVNLVNSLCAGGICLAAIVLFVMDFVAKREAEAPVVYGIAFPFIALAFLLMPFLNDAIRGVFMLVSTMFGTMGTTMLFLMAFRVKRAIGLPATCMYGLSSGFVHVFLFFGLLSGLGNMSPDGSDFARYAVFAAVLVYVFLIVFLISRKRANARKDGSGIVFIGTEQDFSLVCDAIASQHGLSQREREVMRLLMLGLSIDDIASDLGIAVSTVRTHNKNIYKKLGVHTRAELLGLVSR